MQAFEEFQASKGKAAFNILGAKARKLNGFSTRYSFPDGSALVVSKKSESMTCYNAQGYGVAIRMLWN